MNTQHECIHAQTLTRAGGFYFRRHPRSNSSERGSTAMADGNRLLQHLLRRAGFGASSVELAAYSNLSYSQAVDRLVNYEQIPDTVDSNIGKAGFVGTTSRGAFSPNTVADDARQRWLFRMVHSDRPLQEKMTLFWHNYFATGLSKVPAEAKTPNRNRLMAAK